MKKLLMWMAGASLLVTAGGALADGYPSVKDTPYSRPFSWTGFYVGANGGFGAANRTVTFSGNDTPARILTCEEPPLTAQTCASPIKFDLDGWVGGLQGGYNRQLNRYWVVGVEANFDGSGIRGEGTSRFLYPMLNGLFIDPKPANFQSSEELKWFGTLTGRLGVVPTEKSLLFVTGGMAYGRVNQSMTANLPTPSNGFTPNLFAGPFGYECFDGANCFVGTNSKLALGYTLGGGLEIALTNNITVKSEYSYLNLGDAGGTNILAQGTNQFHSPSSMTGTSSKLDYHVVRFGLNIKSDP